MDKSFLSRDQALQKARHFCAYQERCHKEVKEKLYSLGISKRDSEEIMAELVQDNYLNEERFAIQFAGGKFRIKNWGKVKIKYELKQKNISEYCIKKALSEIDEEDYLKTFQKLASDKKKSLKSEKNIFIKKRKLQDFLIAKGFEKDLIFERLSEI
jgi:regulatory protein